MDCHEIQELLSDYIDGLVPNGIFPLVTEHLSECPVCRNEYEKLQNILKECRNIEPVNLPPNFQSLLHESLVRERNKRFLWRRFIRGIAGSAAALLVLLFAFQLSNLVDGRNEENLPPYSSEISEASPEEYSIQADEEEGEIQENSELFRRAESDRLHIVPEENQESLAKKAEDTTGIAASLEDDAVQTPPSDSLEDLEAGDTGYKVQQYHEAPPRKPFAIGLLRGFIYLIVTGSLLYGIRLLRKRKVKEDKK